MLLLVLFILGGTSYIIHYVRHKIDKNHIWLVWIVNGKCVEYVVLSTLAPLPPPASIPYCYNSQWIRTLCIYNNNRVDIIQLFVAEFLCCRIRRCECVSYYLFLMSNYYFNLSGAGLDPHPFTRPILSAHQNPSNSKLKNFYLFRFVQCIFLLLLSNFVRCIFHRLFTCTLAIASPRDDIILSWNTSHIAMHRIAAHIDLVHRFLLYF